MAKRKNAIDKAIDNIDADVAILEGQLKTLKAARERLVAQQKPSMGVTVLDGGDTPKVHQRGHTEGGRGI